MCYKFGHVTPPKLGQVDISVDAVKPKSISVDAVKPKSISVNSVKPKPISVNAVKPDLNGLTGPVEWLDRSVHNSIQVGAQLDRAPALRPRPLPRSHPILQPGQHPPLRTTIGP